MNLLTRICLVVSLSAFTILQVGKANADLLVGSWATHAVYRVNEKTGTFAPFVTSRSGGLSTPDGLAFGPDGNLYVASADTSEVLRYDGRTGEFIDVFASQNINRAGFLSFGPDNYLYVSNGDGRVTRHDSNSGAFVDVFIQDPQLSFPVGLAWSGEHVFVTDFNAPANVLRFDAISGEFVDVFATDPVAPIYPLFDQDGDLLVADYGGNRVLKYDRDGNLVNSLTNPLLSGPVGLLELGDGSLFVTSWNNGRMMRFDQSTGDVLSVWTGIPNPNDVIRFQPIPEPTMAGLMTLLGSVGIWLRRSRNLVSA